MSNRIVGPSPEARLRIRKVLLHFLESEKDSQTVKEIKSATGMTRADADAAIKRMTGSRMLEKVPDSHPWEFTLTPFGERAAHSVAEGGNEFPNPTKLQTQRAEERYGRKV